MVYNCAPRYFSDPCPSGGDEYETLRAAKQAFEEHVQAGKRERDMALQQWESETETRHSYLDEEEKTEELQGLVNRTIERILVNDNQEILVLVTNGSDLILEAWGDCGSESWFADFIGVDNVLHQPIVSVQEIALPDYNIEDGRGRQEEDQVYGIRFTTKRGYADLIFRNSSNGYYGGGLSGFWLPHRIVEKLTQKLMAITSDWSA